VYEALLFNKRLGYVRKKNPIPFCSHDQQLRSWAHPTFRRQAVFSEPICMLASVPCFRDCGFQQETCNSSIRLSCAHSRWSRQSQCCPVTRCTHFHISIWLTFRGHNRTIRENMTLECVGKFRPLPAGPHETERVLQSQPGWPLVVINAVPLNI